MSKITVCSKCHREVTKLSGKTVHEDNLQDSLCEKAFVLTTDSESLFPKLEDEILLCPHGKTEGHYELYAPMDILDGPDEVWCPGPA